MGIGMIMPGIIEDFPFGHMWVYWSKGEDEYYPAYRGYYLLTEIFDIIHFWYFRKAL
jgi:hypothetical protein